MENYTLPGPDSPWPDLVPPKISRNKKHQATSRAETIQAHETNTIQTSPSATKTDIRHDRVTTPETRDEKENLQTKQIASIKPKQTILIGFKVSSSALSFENTKHQISVQFWA
ncbi:hypothetical protein RHGRI_032078 [Rhododendron griersonianum]|uniref:Uncharacterized protein n=1 Tax=Rhododendron griersonianum TaxID=479676 RepID=A0AAV6IG41_9ERIC|nr:hypothetical protein RHGRI_032078 [Rhododendron griersonianum]